MVNSQAPGDVAQGPPGQRVGGFPAADGPAGDALRAQSAVRWYRSDHERDISAKRGPSHRWQHAAPWSVLVWSIGNSWKDGTDSWAKVMDMCQFSHEKGISITFQEGQNRCFEPYDSLGTMRNEAFSAAVSGGYEFLLMIDNDVRPQPDALYRLIMHDEPLIAPYVEEPPNQNQPGMPRRVLHGPFREPYQDDYPVKWNVLSMMLWKTTFINNVGVDFWQDTIGGDEGYHFAKMYAQTGIQPKVDSDIVLEVGGAPLYPLTVKKSDNYEEVWQERRERFTAVPYRQKPGDPRHTPEGVYLPFLPDPNAAPVAPPEAPEGLMTVEQVGEMRERVFDTDNPKPLTLEQSRQILEAAVPASAPQGSQNGTQPEQSAEKPATVS